MMRNVIRMVAVLAFLGNRVAIAQTVGVTGAPTGSAIATAPLKLSQDARSTSVGVAPVGHRQPHPRDVPLETVSELERPSAEDSAIDRKLIICRGC
jgi:hypothetical protein